MMRLALHGGFGEKGRTSLAVEADGYRLLLDAGVKTSAHGQPDYQPAIGAAALARTDAIVITHAHEDHAGALGWCLAHGFTGTVHVTDETRRDLVHGIEGYADPADSARIASARFVPLPAHGRITLGPFTIDTGRSGHIVGGVWCSIDDGTTRFVYCGDVVPESPVFVMDPLPACDVLAIDASYGDDDVAPAARAEAVRAWVRRHPQGALLPTPLLGRSLELLAVLGGPLALAPGMREALVAQLAEREWIVPGVASRLARRLDVAIDWNDAQALPAAPLLCHDGMGMAGPSRGLLEQARATGWPVLLTGHVPEGSRGATLLAERRADWLRLPTHPTLAENRALVAASGARRVLGHSCDTATLTRLGAHLPALDTALVTGDTVPLP